LTDPTGATPYPYAYPHSQHLRRHGPIGYADYESYRAWLRDEFSFRCIYCLYREQWGVQAARWDIDHLSPQARDPDLKLIYENLLYVCSSCNSTKSFHLVPDPCAIILAESLEVDTNGAINALNNDGQILIDILRLDNDDYTQFRAKIIETMEILAAASRETYRRWMGYPDDLPDLERLRPPGGNSKPDGVNDSFFARRELGELEEVY
jgi:hypothetical protein